MSYVYVHMCVCMSVRMSAFINWNSTYIKSCVRILNMKEYERRKRKPKTEHAGHWTNRQKTERERESRVESGRTVRASMPCPFNKSWLAFVGTPEHSRQQTTSSPESASLLQNIKLHVCRCKSMGKPCSNVLPLRSTEISGVTDLKWIETQGRLGSTRPSKRDLYSYSRL